MSHYDYSVRWARPHTFEVSKFGSPGWPIEIYTVHVWSEKYSTCSCMGGRHPSCKHREMVKKYIYLEYPIMNVFWQGNDGKMNCAFTKITKEWKEELEGVINLSAKKKRRKK